MMKEYKNEIMENKLSNIDNLIHSFLEHTITSEELHILQSWINESDINKAYFTELEEAWLLSTISDKKNKFDKEKAFKKFKERIQKENGIKNRTTNFKQVFYYAACIVTAFIIGFSTKYLFESSTYNKKTLAYSIETPRKSKLKLNLPDGSLVWLNAESRIYYNNKFGIDNRDLILEGEGYFEISKNPKLPLSVKLGDANVKVLGTKFNIQNYKENEEMRITLLEGSIAFSNNRNDRSTILKPNQIIKYNKVSGISTIKEINAQSTNGWMDGKILFDEEKLGNIAKVLERSFNIKIQFKNKDLKNLVFYGDITLEADNIVQIMDIMSATNKFKYSYRKNQNEIYIYN